MKQTAVDWFFNNLKSHEIQAEHLSIYKKAKEMEKEQIIEAYDSGVWDVGCRNSDSKRYFKENYKKK